MKHLLLLVSLLVLVGCGGQPAFQTDLVSVMIDGRALTIENAPLTTAVKDVGLEMRLAVRASAVLVVINPDRETRLTIDWDRCRFVWPDGKSEPVLGATPLLGAGQVGMREPTTLPLGLPATLVLTPASRAGREVFGAQEISGGQQFKLVLAMQVNGQAKNYEMTFRISS